MTYLNRFVVFNAVTGLLFIALLTGCASQQQSPASQQYLEIPQSQSRQAPSKSYGANVGNKALNGFTNITTGWMEIPKNVINTANDFDETDVVLGVLGGGLKGLLNALGRTSVGVIDLVSAPFPTKPIVQPRYIWDDPNKNTTYGKSFIYQQSRQIEPLTPPQR